LFSGVSHPKQPRTRHRISPKGGKNQNTIPVSSQLPLNSPPLPSRFERPAPNYILVTFRAGAAPSVLPILSCVDPGGFFLRLPLSTQKPGQRHPHYKTGWVSMPGTFGPAFPPVLFRQQSSGNTRFHGNIWEVPDQAPPP